MPRFARRSILSRSPASAPVAIHCTTLLACLSRSPAVVHRGATSLEPKQRRALQRDDLRIQALGSLIAETNSRLWFEPLDAGPQAWTPRVTFTLWPVLNASPGQISHLHLEE